MRFGTDPELVVVNRVGRPVPAHWAKVGDKKNKHMQLDRGTTFFRDGYMLELNVPPTECRQALTYSVKRATEAALKHLNKYGYHLETKAAVRIDLEKDMANAPIDVLQFGCEPSFCAYTGDTKIPPIDAITHPWRYAGAHLHFSPNSYPTSHTSRKWLEPCLNDPHQYPDVIKALDQYLGLPLTCLFHDKAQYLRRRFYGQAGEYRPQIYYTKPFVQRGLEYRTPGPELWNTPWLASLALGISRTVIETFPRMRVHDAKRSEAVRHAINTGVGRWGLLKPITVDGILLTPSVWKKLWLRFQTTRKRGPRGLVNAGKHEITHGFREWWEGPDYPDYD